MSKQIVLGCRIPKDYFITSGIGESDVGIHAGSYDDALKAARVFTTLMGEDVPPRRHFIQTHAKLATLDV